MQLAGTSIASLRIGGSLFHLLLLRFCHIFSVGGSGGNFLGYARGRVLVRPRRSGSRHTRALALGCIGILGLFLLISIHSLLIIIVVVGAARGLRFVTVPVVGAARGLRFVTITIAACRRGVVGSGLMLVQILLQMVGQICLIEPSVVRGVIELVEFIFRDNLRVRDVLTNNGQVRVELVAGADARHDVVQRLGALSQVARVDPTTHHGGDQGHAEHGGARGDGGRRASVAR